MSRASSVWSAVALAFILLIGPGAWPETFNGPPLTTASRLVLLGLVSLVLWLALFRPAREPGRWTLVLLVVLAVGTIALGTVGSTLAGPSRQPHDRLRLIENTKHDAECLGVVPFV